MKSQKLFLLLFCFLMSTFGGVAQTFTVVIDPGHGGKDPGAVGTKIQEKEVVLDVSKQVGALIKKNYPDVKVIYTRTTDVYVPLKDRPKMANRANADLFISIHANAATSKAAYGAEVFSIGLEKSEANFEVAKRENSVIMLEDNYKETYEGFDPSQPDSYIMFQFMQSQFTQQSMRCASDMQNALVVSAKRHDRGVHQANFWVLHQTKMPSILIELGFVTNANEEKYLLSKSGREELANAIYKGFGKYKKSIDRRSGQPSTDVAAAEVDSTQIAEDVKIDEEQQRQNEQVEKLVEKSVKNAEKKGIIFKVQLFASSSKIARGDARFQGLKCDSYFENGLYKYTYGETTNYQEIEQIKSQVRDKFDSAFVIAYKNGKKIPVQQALKEIK